MGYGIIKYDNGDVYEGNWHFNKKSGNGLMKYFNGEIYEGEFENDMRHGKGKMQYILYLDSTYEGEWE